MVHCAAQIITVALAATSVAMQIGNGEPKFLTHVRKRNAVTILP